MYVALLTTFLAIYVFLVSACVNTNYMYVHTYIYIYIFPLHINNKSLTAHISTFSLPPACTRHVLIVRFPVPLSHPYTYVKRHEYIFFSVNTTHYPLLLINGYTVVPYQQSGIIT